MAGPHGMLLVLDGHAEQRHDAGPHDLVDRALVAMHRRHHALEHRVENRPGVLRATVGRQLHRALRVGEETVTFLRSPSRTALEVRIFSARQAGVYRLGTGPEGPAWEGLRSAMPGRWARHIRHKIYTGDGLANPQAGQRGSQRPHSPQYFRPSGLSKPQLGQCIGLLPRGACRPNVAVGDTGGRPQKMWLVSTPGPTTEAFWGLPS
jgi:hypothetical protein